MRTQEETLRELARTATVRIYIGFDRHFNSSDSKETED